MTDRSQTSPWIEYLRVKPRLRVPAMLILSLLMLAGMAALGYFCWYLWLPPLWSWGFNPTTWYAILSVLGGIYLVIIPLIPLYGLPVIGQILSLYVADHEQELRLTVSDLTAQQREIEDELTQSDALGLMRLMRHSRLELQTYYEIGFSQNLTSFRHSVIAMWIGFFVILLGVVPPFVPLGKNPPSGETIHFLSVGAGLVIEVVSALFLWTYRSSIRQLTYFYNRQMFTYTVIMASRLADSIEDSSDAKTTIIQRLFDHASEHSQPREVPSNRTGTRRRRNEAIHDR